MGKQLKHTAKHLSNNTNVMKLTSHIFLTKQTIISKIKQVT